MKKWEEKIMSKEYDDWKKANDKIKIGAVVTAVVTAIIEIAKVVLDNSSEINSDSDSVHKNNKNL